MATILITGCSKGIGFASALSRFRAIMETNYFGVIRCVQAVLPQMRQRQSGCIINVSPVAGRLSCPPFAAYCASKWALESFSETLACELKTFNVRVALVEPGIIDTAMAQRIGTPATESAYRQSARFAAVFSDSLQQPVPPSLVAEKDTGSREQRRLAASSSGRAGFDSARRMAQDMTDEEWVEVNGADDATFFAAMGAMQS